MQENERLLLELHPPSQWEHCFYNEYDARHWVRTEMPEWFDLYNFYPLDAQREFIFSWLTVWASGGFSVSTTLRPLTNLNAICNGSLFLAQEGFIDPDKFEQIYQCTPPQALPALAYAKISNGAFGAEPKHWFPAKILSLLVERAGLVDSSYQSDLDISFTSGPGILQAAWLESLAMGLPVESHLQHSPHVCTCCGNPEHSLSVGDFGFMRTDLNG